MELINLWISEWHNFTFHWDDSSEFDQYHGVMIRGAESSGCGEVCVLGCNTMSSESQLTLLRNMSPSSSGLKQSLLPATFWFLAWFTLQCGRWRWNVALKYWLTSAGLHGVLSQKTELFWYLGDIWLFSFAVTVTTSKALGFKYGGLVLCISLSPTLLASVADRTDCST
jgi:hypothetical protein